MVLIACSAKYHPVYLRAAIEAGKHVFVEKPHAIDPVGVREVTAACELAKQKKLSVMSGLHSRHDPRYREAIQRVHDGAIGEIVAIEENFLRPPYRLCYREPNLNEVEYQFMQPVPLLLALGRRRAAIAGPQCGSGHVGHEGADAGQGPRTRRAIGLVRRSLRQRFRPSLGGLRVCQWRADVRLLPHPERLLQQCPQLLAGAPRAAAM